MKVISTALLGLAAIAAAPLGAAPAAPAHYLVHFEVREDGQLVAMPSMTVETGQGATFMRGDQSYSLTLVATPDAARNVAIAVDLSISGPNGPSHQYSTLDIAADGAARAIAFHHVDPASGRTIAGDVLVSARAV
jgi:hypothetical protein